MFAVSLALLADAFRGKDRGVAFGVWGAVTGLAVAIGPPPQQAGMASGINSTFRQVGIAPGIDLLGTLFSDDVKTEVLTRTAAVPALSAGDRGSPKRIG
jgi:predicted MFS family arabinose efflux permease